MQEPAHASENGRHAQAPIPCIDAELYDSSDEKEDGKKTENGMAAQAELIFPLRPPPGKEGLGARNILSPPLRAHSMQ